MRRVVALLAFSSGLGLTGAGAVDNCPRAVIELFTSQGCSSCPAADRTLARLAEDKDVIATLEKYDMSPRYMPAAAYDKFARQLYAEEKAALEKLGLAAKS